MANSPYLIADDAVCVLPGRSLPMEPSLRRPALLAVVALGGALGAVARWAATQWWPGTPVTFPWTTFGINVGGSALIGLVMVLLTVLAPQRHLLRAGLVTGVLGGFTTFSTASIDALHLLDVGRWPVALGYLLGTAFAAVGAVVLSTRLARRLVRR